MPLAASSTTAQRPGGSPRSRAAVRNTSGSGLLRLIMPPSTTASSSAARPNFSSISGAFRLEEATAVRSPRLRSSARAPAAPGSASAGVREPSLAR